MAHNHYEHDFVSEYLFQERRPDFAHVHGGWASKLKIRRHSEWEEHYLELPPYPAGGTSSHPGNHVAKRHLVTDTWERGRGATFAWPVNPEEQVDVDAIRAPSEVRIVGWRAPVETGEIGGSLFLEVAMSATGIETATDHFRVTGFLAWPDGARVFFDVAPGYDWYEPSQWLPDDIVVSRIAVPIPDNVETGHPDLGFFVTDRDGVMPVETWSSGALSDFPQASSGEIRWPEAIWIRPSEDILTLALDHMSLLSDTAYMGDCSIAEDLWYAARDGSPPTVKSPHVRSRNAGLKTQSDSCQTPALGLYWRRLAGGTSGFQGWTRCPHPWHGSLNRMATHRCLSVITSWHMPNFPKPCASTPP
jgi:hypothetical protein